MVKEKTEQDPGYDGSDIRAPKYMEPGCPDINSYLLIEDDAVFVSILHRRLETDLEHILGCHHRYLGEMIREASSRGCMGREQHDILLGFVKARNNVLYGQPADLSADNRRKWVEAVRSLEEP